MNNLVTNVTVYSIVSVAHIISQQPCSVHVEEELDIVELVLCGGKGA